MPFYGSELFQLGCPPLASFIAAFLGCLMTLHLSAAGLSPLIASAAAALLLCSSLILTRTADLVPSTFFSSAYGGSFVGMTPVVLLNASVIRAGLPLDAAFTLLSLFCGLVFCLGCALDMWLRGGLARGYGGRLGALAAVTSFLFVGLAPMLGTDGELFPIARRGVHDFGLGAAAITFVLCMAGMSATMAALRWAPVAGSRRAVRILVAATVAFAGLVLLQQFVPSNASELDAYYAGCFLGMSSPRRLRSLLQALAAVVLLTALLILTCPILPAVGGSLGYVAFVSVMFVDAAVRLFIEAGESPQQTMMAWTRGLLAALAILAVLLSSELLFERPRVEPATSLPSVATPAPAEEVKGEGGVPSAPQAIATVPELPMQILRPNGGESLTARRLGEQSPTVPPPTSAEPQRRVVRYGQTAAAPTMPPRRNQAHLIPHSAPRPRIMARQDVQPAPEWRPDPSTSAGP
ncbi:hypothetical protein SSBR45G_40530 [Bradyrhizobium sp. SSBR45G]|uniref:hypothetical protein n=1 Tax=unclassified Bradyrhizobium TaxID=2631580 RepID=UPI002342AB08|nr:MULTISPECIES: hypothetical protein [unclassified Bradyrhizobium]GLH79144.1 hypothetical protein SSBR45G_40530 [Bradyrhizobium sp. SSBR45G]GLH84579.1 hypothetical protein SSBR45R_20390 [Bradyrhizobium sp. SSBR45R]